MIKLEFKRDNNLNKLHDELLAARAVNTNDFIAGNGRELWLEVEDCADIGLIEEVVRNHDPAPLPLSKTAQELQEQRLQLLEQALNEVLLGGGI